MAKINSLRDIIQFNSNFKTAINLYLSLNKAEKVLGYIPTKSSVSFLGEYLKAVLENKEQATLLVGPYGKGKSHLLLVLLAVLSMKKTPESESAINELIDNVSKTDEVGERVRILFLYDSLNRSEDTFLLSYYSIIFQLNISSTLFHVHNIYVDLNSPMPHSILQLQLYWH